MVAGGGCGRYLDMEGGLGAQEIWLDVMGGLGGDGGVWWLIGGDGGGWWLIGGDGGGWWLLALDGRIFGLGGGL